jgi:MFS family permease
MSLKNLFFSIVVLAVLFVNLFYHQGIGINLFLFEALAIGLMLFNYYSRKNKLMIGLALSGVLISLFMVIVHHSNLAIFVNFLSVIFLSGVMAHSAYRSMATAFLQAMLNMVFSWQKLYESLRKSRFIPKKRWIYKPFQFIFIPALFFVIFIIMYKASNPIMDKYVDVSMGFIGDFFTQFIRMINPEAFWLFILGLIISVFLLFLYPIKSLTDYEQNATLKLKRKKPEGPKNFKTMALKTELRGGIILLAGLDLLILLMNIMDIYLVWFNFNWNGQVLKEFVHEGTYILILSLLISIGIALYMFRGNMNFYTKNKWLRYLTYAWLVQNGIMAISVAMRCYWYIHHYSLAYGRIGVLLFLAATLIGIITVIYKIRDRKSAYYLFKTNSASVFILLIIMSGFNWDHIITNYNFNHAGRSFVHFNFLAGLSDNTLPLLDKPLEELLIIENKQSEMFDYDDWQMNAGEYHDVIAQRKKQFRLKMKKRNWLSWNYADWKAKQALKPDYP